MGRRGGVLLVLLGIVLAGAAGIGVYRVAQDARAYRPPTALVVVALQEIPGHSVITPPTLGTKEMLLTSIPPGAVTTADVAVGKMTTENVHLGEVLLKEQLADTSGQSGFAYELKQGEVAISVPAADIIDTGAVRIGDHVDMLITLEPDAQQSGPSSVPAGLVLPATSQTALQDLRVLAIGAVNASGASKGGGVAGTGAGGSGTSESDVVFGVSHEDALYLKALKDAKNVRAELVLRAAGDDTVAKTTPVTLQSVIDRFNLRGSR